MSHKEGNPDIRCKVSSCQYHCTDDLCGLRSIEVEPTPNCNSGKACDESMCGSYKCCK